MKDTILCLCDLTGTMAQPWLDAGYNVILVDPQHPDGVGIHVGYCKSGKRVNVIKVGRKIDDPLTWEVIRDHLHRLAAVFGFPPCTDLAVSGSRHFAAKLRADPACQHKAMAVVHECRTIGEMSGAPWFAENPVSMIASLWRKSDYRFDPWHFTGLAPQDNYVKKTCLWVGGGFVMPERQVLPEVQGAVDAVVAHYGRMVPIKRLRDENWSEETLAWYPDSRIHFASPSDDRANLRSATPAGFAMAVHDANAQEVTA